MTKELRLVEEHKLHELLGRPLGARLEASGVCVRGPWFYVIFDNAPHVARLDRRLRPGDPKHRLFRDRAQSIGFEDVTFHEGTGRFLMIVEAAARPRKEGGFRPRIEEYDSDLRLVGEAWVDLDVVRENKGIEGLTYLRRGGVDYVLGLWESSRSRARMPIFEKGKKKWKRVATLDLPPSVRFGDYSSVSVEGDQIAVVSQESSAVWIGRLAKNALALEGKGTTYRFPRSARGRTRYCTVEGVAWVTPQRLVVVSDRCKRRKQPSRCCKRDQSIHVFDVPR